jgi:putative addiction module killer protein
VDGRRRKRRTYRTEDGAEPFLDWLRNVKRGDDAAIGKIFIRLKRAEEGNFGDHRSEGEGVIALRIGGHGPGYRVYLGIDGEEIILLWGGTKDTQEDDIKRARGFWEEYCA